MVQGATMPESRALAQPQANTVYGGARPARQSGMSHAALPDETWTRTFHPWTTLRPGPPGAGTQHQNGRQQAAHRAAEENP
tara:strand:+ start:311 stop:553 length:243 start_codon:yes stop_codon:yes gene_type:complete